MGKSEGNPDVTDLKSHLQKFWRINIIVPTGDSEFITSDNPAMIFSTNDQRDCHFAMLPVTPKHLAVAFDRRFIDIHSGHTTPADDEILNRNQCRQALTAIYSRTNLDSDQEKYAAKLLKEPKNYGVFSQAVVEFTGLEMLSGSKLSFIKPMSR